VISDRVFGREWRGVSLQDFRVTEEGRHLPADAMRAKRRPWGRLGRRLWRRLREKRGPKSAFFCPFLILIHNKCYKEHFVIIFVINDHEKTGYHAFSCPFLILINNKYQLLFERHRPVTECSLRARFSSLPCASRPSR